VYPSHMATAKKQPPRERAEMDAVLVRMLNAPPAPHAAPAKPIKKAKAKKPPLGGRP
jgi:hypothetical protein